MEEGDRGQEGARRHPSLYKTALITGFLVVSPLNSSNLINNGEGVIIAFLSLRSMVAAEAAAECLTGPSCDGMEIKVGHATGV